MAWQDSFGAGRWTDAFGATAGRTNPHRGTDLAVGTLYAWEELTVETSDTFYANLGYCVILRNNSGRRFGVAHCRKGTRAANGAKLKPGDKIADAASGPRSLSQGNANFPGLQWAGVHFHITMTSGADPFGGSGLLDARPHILAAVAGKGAGVNYGYGLSRTAQLEAQRALKDLGLYSGAVDGEFGVNSVKGMQQYLKSVGLLGSGYVVDGIPGPNYGRAIQNLVAAYGYNGPIDGLPGPQTSLRLIDWAAAVLNKKPAPTPSPAPTPATPPIWSKTYPDVSTVHPSPNREPRKSGSVIRNVILHATANAVDHTAYFSRANERNVAPNLYIRPSGEVKEFVRLSERAWTTGVALDHESVTFEIESAGVYTNEQYEAAAKFIAWLSQQSAVDGVPVDFKITRQSVLGHREVPGAGSTSCPVNLDLNRVVARALDIARPEVKIEIDKKTLEQWAGALAASSKLAANSAADTVKVAGEIEKALA